MWYLNLHNRFSDSWFACCLLLSRIELAENIIKFYIRSKVYGNNSFDLSLVSKNKTCRCELWTMNFTVNTVVSLAWIASYVLTKLWFENSCAFKKVLTLHSRLMYSKTSKNTIETFNFVMKLLYKRLKLRYSCGKRFRFGCFR